MSDPMPGATYLRGVTRLALDATLGLTGVVEAMHHNISLTPWPLGQAEPGPAHGMTGFVYGSIRGVMRLVRSAADFALEQLEPLLDEKAPSVRRQAALAALNGVVGDHLLATGNPLATRMHLRHEGAAVDLERLAARSAAPKGKLLILVHGLCLNDRGWQRLGRDQGAELATELGYTPLHLVYNSGLHVSKNGRQFADVLESVVSRWPVPVREVVLVGHSMGGLVARSACHYGASAAHRWRRRMRSMIFLGTPHHGAALERAGNWADMILELSPYSGPLSALGKIRSAGITDLRHGYLVDEDWQGRDRFGWSPPARTPVPLPSGVRCYAIAGTLATRHACGIVGDGLVSLDSAFGHHDDPALALLFPASRRWVGEGIRHIELLSHPQVFEQIRRWLQSQ